MRYLELANFDSTPDQDLALNIAFKQAKLDPLFPTDALSPGDFLQKSVIRTLNEFSGKHVTSVKDARISKAFDNADDQTKQAVAQVLGVDLAVTVPN